MMTRQHYELRLRDLNQAYRKQRQKLLEELGAKRREIVSIYKDERHVLLVEDCELVCTWRQQLVNGEITPPDGGGQHEEGGREQ